MTNKAKSVFSCLEILLQWPSVAGLSVYSHLHLSPVVCFHVPVLKVFLMLVWEGLGALPLQYISDRLPPAVLTLLQQKSSGRQDLCKS